MSLVRGKENAVSVFLTTVLLASYRAAFSHQDSRELTTARSLNL